MTMNRVVHAAVRRDLGRLETALDTFRDGDTERARDLQRAYGNLRRELTHHHESEDSLIFPMLEGVGVDHALVREMETEHQRMSTALAGVTTALDDLAASGSRADAEVTHAKVVETRAVVDQHLDHEERDLEPLVHPHVGSPEWDAVEKKLRSRPIGESGQFFAWLQDGMEERCRVYLRSTIPRPVTVVLSKVFGRRYHREVAPVWRDAA